MLACTSFLLFATLAVAGARPLQRVVRARAPAARLSLDVGEQRRPGAQLLEALPSHEELQAAIRSGCTDGGLTVVLFGSKQCASCRAMLPRTRRLAAALPCVRFFYVEHGPSTEDAFLWYEVTKAPSFIIFDGQGEIVDSKSGLSPSDWGDFRKAVESYAECEPWGA